MQMSGKHTCNNNPKLSNTGNITLLPDIVRVISLLLDAVEAAAPPPSHPCRHSTVIIDDWLLIGCRGGHIHVSHAAKRPSSGENQIFN